MEIDDKVKILKRLDTKSLIARIQQYEDDLEHALRDQASFKDTNR